MSFSAPAIVKENRQPNYPIHPLIYSRWSPRAMSGEAVAQDELLQLFEAARWAPSSQNKQPWTFLYTHRDGQYWPIYFDFLGKFNQIWAKHAGVLVVITAQVEFDGQKSEVSKFDTGAAWENLALEATHLSLIAHPIGGFDHQQAAEKLNVPKTHQVMAMIAIGRPGELSQIPERMHKQEKPNQRKSLSKVAIEGSF